MKLLAAQGLELISTSGPEAAPSQSELPESASVEADLQILLYVTSAAVIQANSVLD